MKRRLLAAFFIPCLLLTMVLPLLHPATAAALSLSDVNGGGSYTFQDRGTIVASYGSAGQVTFTDANVNDGTDAYKPASSSDFCDLHHGSYGIVLTGSKPSFDSSDLPATLNVGINRGSSHCTKVTQNTSISIVNNNTVANAKFEWSGNNITSVAGQSSTATFIPGSNSPNYYVDKSSFSAFSCTDESAILVNSGNQSGTLYCFTGRDLGESIPAAIKNYAPESSSLEFSDNINISGTKGSASAGSTSSSDSDGSTNSNLDCAGDGNPLSWLICPIVNGLVDVIDAVDSLITQQLVVGSDSGNDQPTQIFGDSGGDCASGATCNGYYNAWQNIRDIALGLMVIAGLIIVIAQALGIELLDAYAIRKTLPRLLLVAIGITLSWPIMRFLVLFTNDLGFGIRHLIYAPFVAKGSGIKDTLTFGTSATSIFKGILELGAAAPALGVGYLIFGAMGLLTYAGAALLAVMIAFVILVLRQIAITLLIILAPLAIVAYILPNTEKYYKIWWESFSKALFMFPLIAAFIAAGRVFSAIAISEGGALNEFIGFIAYFAPYFLIPATVKFAGGALRQIGGFVNDRSRGGFDRLRNKRNATVKDRVQRARSGGIYRDAALGGLGKKLNKFGSYTLDADEQLQYDVGSGTGLGRVTGKAGKAILGRQANLMGGQIAHATAEQTAKAVQKENMHYTTAYAGAGLFEKLDGDLSDTGKQQLYDAFGTGIGADGKKAYRAPTNYSEMIAAADILEHEGASGSNAVMAGEGLREHAGSLSNMRLDEETRRASIEDVSFLSAAKDGKLNNQQIANHYNRKIAEAKKNPAAIQTAQQELAQIQRAATQQRPDQREGKGIRLDEQGKAYSVYDVSKRNALGEATEGHYQSAEALDSLLTAKPGAVSGGKGEYFDETGDAYKFHANQKEQKPDGSSDYTDQAKQLRMFLVQQSGMYGQGDAGAKAKVDALKRAVGIDKEEEVRYMRDIDQNQLASGGGAGTQATPDPTSGVTPPGVGPPPSPF
jgi:hypothetical protein